MSSTQNLIGAFLGTFVQFKISSEHLLGHSINSESQRRISWHICWFAAKKRPPTSVLPGEFSINHQVKHLLVVHVWLKTLLVSLSWWSWWICSSDQFFTNFTNFSPTLHQLFTKFTNFSQNSPTFHQLHQLFTNFTNFSPTSHQLFTNFSPISPTFHNFFANNLSPTSPTFSPNFHQLFTNLTNSPTLHQFDQLPTKFTNFTNFWPTWPAPNQIYQLFTNFTNFTNFSPTFHQLLTNFSPTFHQLFTNFADNFSQFFRQQLVTNFSPTFPQLFTNFANFSLTFHQFRQLFTIFSPTTCHQLFTNFSPTFHQFFTKFTNFSPTSPTFHQLFTKFTNFSPTSPTFHQLFTNFSPISPTSPTSPTFHQLHRLFTNFTNFSPTWPAPGQIHQLHQLFHKLDQTDQLFTNSPAFYQFFTNLSPWPPCHQLDQLITFFNNASPPWPTFDQCFTDFSPTCYQQLQIFFHQIGPLSTNWTNVTNFWPTWPGSKQPIAKQSELNRFSLAIPTKITRTFWITTTGDYEPNNCHQSSIWGCLKK